LVTTSGYVETHAIRTGDYDALLTFFLTLGSFSFFIFLEYSKPKFLYLFFISMILAVLTKSAAGLMILPGLFIYTIFKRKLIFMLKNKHLYIGLFLFLICTGAYYYLREILNPGYLSAVLNNEYGTPFIHPRDGHRRDFWLYFRNLFDNKFILWAFFIPAGIIVGYRNKDLRIKNLTLFASITALTFFLVISSAQTRISWYALPLYPFLALLVGIFVFYIFSFIKEKENLKYKALPYIFLIFIFITPYCSVLGKFYIQQKRTWKKEDNGVCYYLRDIQQGKIQNDHFTIMFDGYFVHGKFYLNPLLKQGKTISLKDLSNDVKAGEVVVFSQNSVKDFLEEKYEIKTIEEFYVTGIYEIVSKKNINL
jgi:4-amino-4-deoxy-L-arabinose transferase-like glycosyltransferase